ncbi:MULTISPECIES: cupin domain-containing protein [Haloarcula]|uniref:Cupin type-2 domain-containing protein n=1 Tax=Haloarcula pellucida TaxID=1427151 RepID=A0A830GL44_9EURY|nr:MULTISPECIES: cupin domain-containing protein [Halomicroarcula]MBX0348427.1 cupin domain-containing protein [Halomicroarcula pellucida]MDS0278251.1 cupin domain-containing protein [Halomicroarcula sp. S1AR25-4]GGN93400.1 hypothetical protein GCM10009030_18810 [Halomicroarcula pellucida]
MVTITTGRPVDENGDPLDGPALELDPDGPAAEMLADSPYPLASSPASDTWSAITQFPERDNSSDPAMVVWLGPDATELPPHVHRHDSEYFRALTGEVTFVVDEEPHRLGRGEDITVEPGEEHYFRNDTDEHVAFYAEVPWTKTIVTQLTAFGMDHEGKFSSDGSFSEPDAIQGLLLSEYISDGTRITAVPFAVQRLAWATVGRVATLMGREATDDKYMRDEFWERRVEQPDL